MADIEFHGDLLRLVLGYLNNHGLRETADSLVAAFPNLQAHNYASDNLEKIIADYISISNLMDRAADSMPWDVRQQFNQLKLCAKVKYLLTMMATSEDPPQ
ncbi:hypothetical protein KR018_002556 [Drosophila ironensis]|nr:hypothetical protein KR018_002556 [Drosophila ironensis]